MIGPYHIPKIRPDLICPCGWRRDEETQKYRLRVPEPAQVPEEFGDRVRYRIDTEFSIHWIPDGCIPEATDYRDGEFRKILVCEPGVKYWAWTADGRTPIFPIPL